MTKCECELGRFTCRHCLENAKPYHYTSDDGTRYPAPPVDLLPKKRTPLED